MGHHLLKRGSIALALCLTWLEAGAQAYPYFPPPGIGYNATTGNLTLQNLTLDSVTGIVVTDGSAGVARAATASDITALVTIPAAANPTGTVGLSAVNGTATTFPRSDSAPALSQSIVPTWTGLHTFADRVVITAPSSGTALMVTGAANAGVMNVVSGNSPTAGANDVAISRAGSTANAIQEGPNLYLNDSTNTTGTTLQHSGGQTEIYQFNGGWNQLAFWSAARDLTLNTPASGNTLTVNGQGANSPLVLSNGGAANAINITGPAATQMGVIAFTQSGQSNWTIYQPASSSDFRIFGNSADRMIINNVGAVALPGLAATSAATNGTVCWVTSGLLTVDTTTTCLLSSARFKQRIRALENGLGDVMRLRPVSYELRPEFDPYHLGRQVGFIAEDVARVDPRLVALDDAGRPRAVRYLQMTSLLVQAVQQQQYEIYGLAAALAAALVALGVGIRHGR